MTKKLQWFLELKDKVNLPEIYWEKFMSTINFSEIGTFRQATMCLKNYINASYKPQRIELEILKQDIANCHSSTTLGVTLYYVFWVVFLGGALYTCYKNINAITENINKVLDYFKFNNERSFGDHVSAAVGEVSRNLGTQKDMLLNNLELFRLDKEIFKLCGKMLNANSTDVLDLTIQVQQIAADLEILQSNTLLNSQAINAITNMHNILEQLLIALPAGAV